MLFSTFVPADFRFKKKKMSDIKIFTGIPEVSNVLLNNNISEVEKVFYYLINILREGWAKLFQFCTLKLTMLFVYVNASK